MLEGGGSFYLKLIDFGEAKIVDTYNDAASAGGSSDGHSSFFGKILGRSEKRDRKKGTFVGTPLYCSPEMLKNNQSGLYSDLWALGCIIFELCAGGQKMFGGKNR